MNTIHDYDDGWKILEEFFFLLFITKNIEFLDDDPLFYICKSRKCLCHGKKNEERI